MMTTLSRRVLLKTTIAGGMLHGFQHKARAVPSERITLGFVGLGERGTYLLKEFLREPDVQVLAICDCEDLHYREREWGSGKALGRAPACAYIDKVSGAPPVLVTSDFHEVCEHQGVDAVVVATPDHWHAICALEALKNRKDVYCEKPVVHRFREGLSICQAVKEYQRVFQTGSQQRSTAHFRQAVELIRNGVLGGIDRMEVGLPAGYQQPMGSAAVTAPPDAAVYDQWCGPAARLPFMRARYHRWWRGHSAFGGGVLMDWIGHHNDIAHWSLNLDQSGPRTVTATMWTPPPTQVYNTPWHYSIQCEFDNGVQSTIADDNALGTKWIGPEGWIHVTRGRISASDTRWLAQDFEAGPFRFEPLVSHVRNFLDCIKRRKTCVAPAEAGHRSITPGHLGYVSHQVGRSLTWNAQKQRIENDPIAQKLLVENEYRDPWHLPS